MNTQMWLYAWKNAAGLTCESWYPLDAWLQNLSRAKQHDASELPVHVTNPTRAFSIKFMRFYLGVDNNSNGVTHFFGQIRYRRFAIACFYDTIDNAQEANGIGGYISNTLRKIDPHISIGRYISMVFKIKKDSSFCFLN